MLRPILKKLCPLHPTLADSAWGNLVYLVKDAGLIYGYGFPLVAPLVETEDEGFSIEDILMKLTPCFGSQGFLRSLLHLPENPLRELLNLAPQKYANIRDITCGKRPLL